MFSKWQTFRRLLGRLDHLEHLDAIPDIAEQLALIRQALAKPDRSSGDGHPVQARTNGFQQNHAAPAAPEPSSGAFTPYWPDIDAAIRLHLTPDDVVFDIGANHGVTTGLFASIAAQVVAFEPNPELAATLRARDLPTHVRIEELAMSDREGEATFHVDIRPGVGAVASSLMELIDLQASGMTRPVTVRTTTVDSYADKGPIPTFIKIDVEGHEPAVLQGARKTIETHRPTIIFEMWEGHWDRFADIFEWLSRSHYLIRVSDGADARAFYTAHSAHGGADILAVPRRTGRTQAS